MYAKDLSVCIPARNEEFLELTIKAVFDNAEADTEVIAVLDGYRPNPPIEDRKKVTFIHNAESVGQRASTNDAVKLSRAKYIMKADAHCSFAKGFDKALMADCEHDWTVIPMMYNLHAFDWKCLKCGDRTYQAPKPTLCGKCKEGTEFERVIVWGPRRGRKTMSWRFDSELHFQYWHRSGHPDFKEGLSEVMSFIGACWFMERDRYWEIDGLDEATGIWGQVGTEMACKAWLSGGKLVCNKKTWYGHLFRTQFGFPYHISGNAQERAKIYSRDFWRNNRWPKQKYPLRWLIDRFWPVPGWTEEERDRLSDKLPL